MFERDALKDLREWSVRPKRKPLVLRGARQVGKTSLVDMFGQEFDIYMKLNLEKPNDAALFEKDLSADELLTIIYLHCNFERKPVLTLLFIDEIQSSPKAVAMLRYFYEEIPGLHLIAAGSLLETLIDRHISFPVGRVEYMALRPCTFFEFLGATGEHELKKVVQQGALPMVLHQKVLHLFHTYTLIGGMPEIVAHYAQYRDIVALNHLFETLIGGYQDDVEKYCSKENLRNVVRHILKEGWAFAGSRITFERFASSNYRSREMGDAFRTLEKTMLLELSYPTTGVQIPLIGELKRSPKLLWMDTGLVNHVGNLQQVLITSTDLSDSWRGRIAEHIVGQELIGADRRISARRLFWVNSVAGSDAEVDFLTLLKGRIVPIEVKSGHNTKLKSLHQFIQKSGCEIAIRFWGKELSVDDLSTPSGKRCKLFNLPYYYAGCIDKVVVF